MAGLSDLARAAGLTFSGGNQLGTPLTFGTTTTSSTKAGEPWVYNQGFWGQTGWIGSVTPRFLPMAAAPPQEEIKQVAVADLEPLERVPVTTAEMDAEYLRVARKLGIKSSAIDEAQMLQVLKEETLGIYDLAKVRSYMSAKIDELVRGRIKAENPKITEKLIVENFRQQRFQWSWHWAPARSQDQDALANFSFSGTDGGFFNRPYDKAIPLPVLLTMEKVQDRLPEARFLVSDYAERRPDPFLAVTTKKLLEANPGNLYVVDKWDEPSFRG